jgi:hypothetical protein
VDGRYRSLTQTTTNANVKIQIMMPAIMLYQFCFQAPNNFKHFIFVAQVQTQDDYHTCQGHYYDFRVKILKKSVMKKPQKLLHFLAIFQKQSESMFFIIINVSFNSMLQYVVRGRKKFDQKYCKENKQSGRR